ncbi:MAG: glycosyltransferase family 4 protein [Bacteroidota bacterium]
MQKILVYSDRFGGNTTTFIYNEVMGLVQNFQVKCVCTERLNPEIFPFEDVEIVPYEVNRVVRKLRWWAEIYDQGLIFKNTAFSNRINQIVEEFQPDLIHCHFGYEALRFVDNLDRKDIPIVVSFRGHDASYFLGRKTYVNKLKGLLSRKNVFPTFVCNFLKENLERVGLSVGTHLILYSGTKVEVFKRQIYKEMKDPFTFLQVSHFEERKGHIHTLEAFKRLVETIPTKRVKLVLAGGGPDLEKMKAMAKSYDLGEKVLFPGWVSPQEVRELLEVADAYVLHSITVDGWTEGIPNALMEAMAMELPLVSTRHAGIPELVEEGVHGILTDERDVEAYVEGMKEVMSWGYKVENREQVEDKFEYNKHMQHLRDYYQQILQQEAEVTL